MLFYAEEFHHFFRQLAGISYKKSSTGALRSLLNFFDVKYANVKNPADLKKPYTVASAESLGAVRISAPYSACCFTAVAIQYRRCILTLAE